MQRVKLRTSTLSAFAEDHGTLRPVDESGFRRISAPLKTGDTTPLSKAKGRGASSMKMQKLGKCFLKVGLAGII